MSVLQFSICHIGWNDKDFEQVWKRLAKQNPPQKQDFTANTKIWKRCIAKVLGGTK